MTIVSICYVCHNIYMVDSLTRPFSESENSEERDIKHAVSFFDRAQRAFQQELANVAAAAAASGANVNSDNQGSTVLDILTR